jgi:hypothetical protein
VAENRERRISDAAQSASAKGERITGQAGEQPKRNQARAKNREPLFARFEDSEQL